MGKISAIEWTDATWNPFYGCSKVSEGCKNCYAERDMKRFGRDFSKITRSKTTFNDPLKWKESKRIFVCSWGDFFHEDIPLQWLDEVWDIIRKCPQHTFLLLTKRAHIIRNSLPLNWVGGYPNVWLGVSVENQKRADERIPQLLKIPAAVHFVSAEPLLSKINLTPWLRGYIIETQKESYHERGRDPFPSADRHGDIFHGRARSDMETQGICGRGQIRSASTTTRTRHSSKGRTKLVNGIQDNNVSDRSRANESSGTSNSMDDRQRSPNSEWAGNKSQERQESRQQTRKSRDGDASRKCTTRGQSFESSGEKGTMGREEHKCKINTPKDIRNTCNLEGQIPEPNRTSTKLRSHTNNDQQYMYRQNLETPSFINWIICGGESGSNARPMKEEWAQDIRDQCQKHSTAFFYKQHGGSKKINGAWGGRELDGRTWDEFPE